VRGNDLDYRTAFFRIQIVVGYPSMSNSASILFSALSSVLALLAMQENAAVDIDHLILGINDLDRGIREFESRTGVTPKRGGEHPGRGTQNALVTLGNGRYLEILAPASSQALAAGRESAVDHTQLTLVGWALRTRAIGTTVEQLRSNVQALDLSLGFHESTGTGRNPIGERLEPNFMLRRVFSQPMEQMLALGCFCGGGVLARHPKLRVAFLEANCSWLPWLLWRLDEAWELDGDVFAPDLQQKPSDYFKRQCRVSIEPDEVIASNVIEQVGSDYLVFSTDYPHVDSRYPEAVNYFLRLPLRDEHKRKILWDNCMSYYAMAA